MRILFTAFVLVIANYAKAQQVNPVPDYTFANRMSAGRNTVTDTAAYFSIGPRYGAVRGMMPPMVVDTSSVSGNKRNGLLIFSIQKNKFLYWDSVGSKWAEMSGTAGSAITGTGSAGYISEFTTATNIDSTKLYHSAGRFSINSTNVSNGVFNVYGGQTYLDTNLRVGSVFFVDETNSRVGINTTTPAVSMDIVGNAQISGIDSNSGRLNIYTGAFSTSNAVQRFLVADTSVDAFNLRIRGTTGGVFNSTINGRINNNGDAYFNGLLGIGTSTPTGTTNKYINIYGTASNELHLTNATTGTNGGDGFTILQSGNDIYVYNYENGFIEFGTQSANRLRINSAGESLFGAITDAGAYTVQVSGAIYNTTTITTGAPTSGTAKPWRLGEVATVSPTSPNRTIRVEIDGTVYYIHAKTTND